jgi:putative transposase
VELWHRLSVCARRLRRRQPSLARRRTGRSACATHIYALSALACHSLGLQRMAFYRRNLPHLQDGCRALFTTFRVQPHRLLIEKWRSIVLDHILFDHQRRYDLHAAVVMNSHVHLLFSPLPDQTGKSYSLATIMRGLKGSSARSINQQGTFSGSVWQDESFDRLVRDDGEFGRYYEYILQNAAFVTPGNDPYDYPWLWTHTFPERRDLAWKRKGTD